MAFDPVRFASRAARTCAAFASLSSAALAVGCANTSPAAGPDRAEGEPRTLVWITGGGADGGDASSPTTYALSPEGDVVGREDGVRLVAAGTEWTCVVTTEPVATQDCHESNEQPAGAGRAVRVRLVPADPAKKPLEIVSPAGADDTNEIEQSARLLASIGPYVFVEDTTYAYTCGAHGNTGVSFAVWNVDEGRKVDLVSDLPDRATLLSRGKEAIDAQPDAYDFSRPEDPPTITEIVPRLDAAGRLKANALVTIPTCYACTRGGWSSYTASAEVATELPWRLRALGPPPPAVARFAAAHPDAVIGGYSAGTVDRARSTRP